MRWGARGVNELINDKGSYFAHLQSSMRFTINIMG